MAKVVTLPKEVQLMAGRIAKRDEGEESTRGQIIQILTLFADELAKKNWLEAHEIMRELRAFGKYRASKVASK